MHTYREAIKNVTGAFALYPGNELKIYPSHGAAKIYQGIGALPLKPVTGGEPENKHLISLEAVICDFINF